jgi:hypothetical protein
MQRRNFGSDWSKTGLVAGIVTATRLIHRVDLLRDFVDP